MKSIIAAFAFAILYAVIARADPYAAGQETIASSRIDQLFDEARRLGYATSCNVIIPPEGQLTLSMIIENLLVTDQDTVATIVRGGNDFPNFINRLRNEERSIEAVKPSCEYWTAHPEAVKAMRDYVGLVLYHGRYAIRTQ
jgi:hypothetical protein